MIIIMTLLARLAKVGAVGENIVSAVCMPVVSLHVASRLTIPDKFMYIYFCLFANCARPSNKLTILFAGVLFTRQCAHVPYAPCAPCALYALYTRRRFVPVGGCLSRRFDPTLPTDARQVSFIPVVCVSHIYFRALPGGVVPFNFAPAFYAFFEPVYCIELLGSVMVREMCKFASVNEPITGW